MNAAQRRKAARAQASAGYRAVPAKRACTGCAFRFSGADCYAIPCQPWERIDGKSVIFVHKTRK